MSTQPKTAGKDKGAAAVSRLQTHYQQDVVKKMVGQFGYKSVMQVPRIEKITLNMRWLSNIASTLHPGEPVYVLLYSAAIIFFCFFYAALMFNPKETAENLKKSGAFVPGIRPGDQTARYIEKIMLRLTLVGSVYVTLVCLLPEFLIVWKKVPFYFGGTSLLIIVVVTMDFMAQVQAYAMSHQYESLLKKANFKGGVFPTR